MAKKRKLLRLSILGVSIYSSQLFALTNELPSSHSTLGACVAPGITSESQLWQSSGMSYIGGFRVTSAQSGRDQYSTSNYSKGAFTLSENGGSIFIAGHNAQSQIGEMEIPALVNTRDMTKMNVGGALQDFAPFHDPDGRYDSGIPGQLVITGMLAIDGKLLVNHFNWYDASGEETDTTSIYQDATKLATTSIVGPFQLDGAAHSAGWISPVPAEWQTRLGGTHVSGWSQGSINGRLSNGPSAYIWNPKTDALNKTSGTAINAKIGINFPLNAILYRNDLYDYDGTYAANEHILRNVELNNDLWTYRSGAGYGFIIPNTDTYMTVGHSAGHNSGVGYKFEYEDGKVCAGNCARDRDDYYNYFWLWDVNDIEAALNGDISPDSVRPYDYGVMDTIGSKAKLTSGYFDPSSGKLYVSLEHGDEVSLYNRPPLFLVYQINY